jgi:hypothetical protein
MAKQTTKKQQFQELTPLEKLGLRVSSMINAPKAQLERRVTIHRLDTDPDEAWEAVIELLVETDGLEMSCNSDGAITLKWDRSAGDDTQACDGEFETITADEAAF